MTLSQKILAAGIVALVGGSAVADSVYVEFGSSRGQAGRGLWVSLSGGLTFFDGETDKTVWAGHRSMTVDGQQGLAFSAELTERNTDGWFETMTLDAAYGSAKAEAIRALFGSHASDAVLNRETASAFQALLWEIVYDYDGDAESIDLATGSLRIAGVAGVHFADMKSSALRGGGSPSIEVVRGDDGNDNFRIVPLPSTAGLASAGLLGFAASHRRRSRSG